MNTTTQILEGPRFEAGANIKMDTSLEHGLPKSINEATTTLSPYSDSTDTFNSERGSCRHTKTISQENYETCFHCGAYVSKSGVKTFKGKKMNYTAFFPAKTIYETMTRRSCSFKQAMNPEYSQIRQTYVEWVLELADKLRISANSAHLAIILLDTVMFKDITLTSKLQLYAPVCLLIASKTIELDERIPFIPKLRRYANPTFSVDEYRKAELHALDLVDWNPQFSSALEINEFLMCQGVLFSTDEIEDNISPNERIKWSPEVLRENRQHENTVHLEAVKAEDKKEITNNNATSANKELEKTLSPGSKENNENSYSETTSGVSGTNGESTATAGQQQAAQEGIDEESPTKTVYPSLSRQHSTPANIESYMSIIRNGMSVEKKIGEILTNFEISYVKLSTIILKDIEFIEWEPKVVSASMTAFFRCVNRITPIWNPELEAITQLKFQQISSCFDLIHKKYNLAFNVHAPKLQNVYYTGAAAADNQREDFKLAKANSVLYDKTIYPQPKFELSNRTNLINNNSINFNKSAASGLSLISNNDNSTAVERKSIFNYQPKPSIPAATTSTVMSYNSMRDDLRFRTKYANGTINTEIPQRNNIINAKNPIFPPSHPNKYSGSQDYPAQYFTNSSAVAGLNTSVCNASTGYQTAGSHSSLNSDPAYSSKLNVSKK